MNINDLHSFIVGNLAFGFAGALLFAGVAQGASEAGTVFVPGTSEHIAISDCVRVIRDRDTGVVRVDRILDAARGYRWDGPGVRIRFRTDSVSVVVRLVFSERHVGPARNSIGFYRIDGRSDDTWRFTRPGERTSPGADELALTLPVPSAPGAAGTFHDYELILPYGDSVELKGVTVAATARWAPPATRPKIRWVAFGDSVTHGFTASAATRGYPFLVGEKMNWETINAGIGGRECMSSDGAILAGMQADVFSIMIGVNNWQVGTEPEVFRVRMAGLLESLSKGRPDARIYVITPLWVAPGWKPAGAKYPLEKYRGIIREVVARLETKRIIVIDGPTLIDENPALFDKVSVHPNDAGFALMAERLAEIFRRPATRFP